MHFPITKPVPVKLISRIAKLRADGLARHGGAGPTHTHHHGDIVHRHAGAAAHVHVGRWTLARRPLIVGAGMTTGAFHDVGDAFSMRVITRPDADIVEDRLKETA